MGVSPSSSAATPAEDWVPAVGIAAERLPHRGLANDTGQNTCFLNVCLQALWHLGSFRRALDASPPHSHYGRQARECVTCALRSVYAYYKFSDEAVIPPDEARQALALVDARTFPLGEMADAAETLEAILSHLHADAVIQQCGPTRMDPSDVPCSPQCAAHASFSYSFLNWLKCSYCGASTEPRVENAFVYQVNVAQVAACLSADRRTEPTVVSGATSPAPPVRPDFSTVLSAIEYNDQIAKFRSSLSAGGEAAAAVDPHSASGNGSRCGVGTLQVRPERIGLDVPPVFCLSLGWLADRIDKGSVVAALRLVSQLLDFRQLFALGMEDSVGDGSGGRSAPHVYRLRGMVLYYGKHYVAVVASESMRAWLLLDDTRISVVGDWAAVVDKCVACRYQPTILFYELMQHDDATQSDGGSTAGQLQPGPAVSAHCDVRSPLPAPPFGTANLDGARTDDLLRARSAPAISRNSLPAASMPASAGGPVYTPADDFMRHASAAWTDAQRTVEARSHLYPTSYAVARAVPMASPAHGVYDLSRHGGLDRARNERASLSRELEGSLCDVESDDSAASRSVQLRGRPT